MTFRIAISLALAVFISSRGEEVFFEFSRTPEGRLPEGFVSELGGEGSAAQWEVVKDKVPSQVGQITGGNIEEERSVLAQLSKQAVDEHFPMLIYSNVTTADFTFTTRFKCVSGEMEQMAGVVFRYVDARNYYYVRASAKGGTFRFFKVVGGQRSAPIGQNIEIPAGKWHELKVQCKGTEIMCSLNGKQVIPTLSDNSLTAGKVGFWTKSDAVSHFVDARLEYKAIEPLARKLLREMHAKYPRVRGMRIYAKPPEKAEWEVVASTRPEELGKAAGEAEKGVVEHNSPYFGRLKPGVVVTLPLHDRNGEVVGVLRVEMRSFLGQTENNAVARALPIAKDIELRIVEVKDLL